MVIENINANRILRSHDSEWSSLTECALSEFMQNHNGKEEPMTRNLFQAMRDLELPPECVENIKITLGRFANRELADIKQGKLEQPGSIRLFCQKKMINGELNGGCGYFLIEKTGNSSASASGVPSHFIDLYLYVEGE